MKLHQYYNEKLCHADGGNEYFNRMAVPKVVRVVVNTGIKEAAHDKGLLKKRPVRWQKLQDKKLK